MKVLIPRWQAKHRPGRDLTEAVDLDSLEAHRMSTRPQEKLATSLFMASFVMGYAD